jgi:predicted RNA-binding Zn-ribbon protein involved in translation (DUF1610 family)
MKGRAIPVSCLNCGWKGRRNSGYISEKPCPICGSTQVWNADHSRRELSPSRIRGVDPNTTHQSADR